MRLEDLPDGYAMCFQPDSDYVRECVEAGEWQRLREDVRCAALDFADDLLEKIRHDYEAKSGLWALPS